MRLRWTNPALRDLGYIHAFIAEHGSDAALRGARMLRAQAESLTAHPQMGRPGRVEGTRELVVARSPFIITYRITAAAIDILAIRHGARQWPDRLEG